MGQRPLARDGLDHGNAPVGGEFRQRGPGPGIAHPAARDDQRLLCPFQDLGRLGHTLTVGARARDGPVGRREELLRVVEGQLLRVLRQRDEGGPAIGRVEHRRQRLRQGRDDLRGMRDPVPVAGHRAEGIVHGHGRVVIVFDLLQHRVRQAIGERIPRDQQQGQAVGMGRSGRRHHVQRARPYRRGGDHDLSPALRFGVAHRCKRHRLFVLPAPCRKLVLHCFQRLAEAGHIAVAEDSEDTCEQRHPLAVNGGELVAQIAHQRLCHGQANGPLGHRESSLASLPCSSTK